MYNVRSTTEAPSGAHVRCTIAEFARFARGSRANATRNFEGHARTWLQSGGRRLAAGGAAYVRGTTRTTAPNSREAAAHVRCTTEALGSAHVRGTTRTTAPMRAHAQRAVSAYGQREGAARRANRQGGAGESTFDVRLRCSRALRGNLAEREASAPTKANALGNCVCRLFDSFLLESLALGS